VKLRIAVLLALALGLFSSSAFAQPALEYKAIGGIGFGTMSFDDDSDSEFFDGQRTGLIIGGGVEIPAGNVIVIGVELLYNQKGASGSIPDFEQTLKLDYIEIPILVKYPFNIGGNYRPFVYGGFAPAFNVSAKSDETDFGEDFEVDLDDQVKGFDNSFVLGGGVRFGQMAAEVRYNLGVQNIAEEGDDVKTRQFSILFSYMFGGL
jgi:hypothetical protein